MRFPRSSLLRRQCPQSDANARDRETIAGVFGIFREFDRRVADLTDRLEDGLADRLTTHHGFSRCGNVARSQSLV
jgi:hypothetical protein